MVTQEEQAQLDQYRGQIAQDGFNSTVAVLRAPEFNLPDTRKTVDKVLERLGDKPRSFVNGEEYGIGAMTAFIDMHVSNIDIVVAEINKALGGAPVSAANQQTYTFAEFIVFIDSHVNAIMDALPGLNAELNALTSKVDALAAKVDTLTVGTGGVVVPPPAADNTKLLADVAWIKAAVAKFVEVQ